MPKPFDISLWEHNTKKKAGELEHKRCQVLDNLQEAILKLSKTYHWDALYIFGSISKAGQFKGNSDIDIGIQGLDKFLHYQLVADLSGMMDRDVDVVRLEDCSFAETIKKRGILWKKGT